jgi:hypothetical protein
MRGNPRTEDRDIEEEDGYEGESATWLQQTGTHAQREFDMSNDGVESSCAERCVLCAMRVCDRKE